MPDQVFLIRHGQSAFNAALERLIAEHPGLERSEMMTKFEPLRVDASLRDARLSELGHEQVAAAAAQARSLDVDVVIVSPLTRAIQTGTGLFGTGVRIEASPIHAERVFAMCDLGRPPAELAVEFPHVDFAHLDDVWWHWDPAGDTHGIGLSIETDEAFNARVARFSGELAARPEARVAVVGHGLFFQAICGRHLDNCEILPFTLPG